jgi:hypothetical protein
MKYQSINGKGEFSNTDMETIYKEYVNTWVANW